MTEDKWLTVLIRTELSRLGLKEENKTYSENILEK